MHALRLSRFLIHSMYSLCVCLDGVEKYEVTSVVLPQQEMFISRTSVVGAATVASEVLKTCVSEESVLTGIAFSLPIINLELEFRKN